MTKEYYPHLKPHPFSTTLSLLIREKEGVWSKWLWLSALATASIAAADRKKKDHASVTFLSPDLWCPFQMHPSF
jgi:hypothetical protein